MLSVNGNSCAQGSRLPLRKYYLDIASEFTVHTDDRGVMLSDLAAAHRHAVSVIWNCMRFDTEEQRMWLRFSEQNFRVAKGSSGSYRSRARAFGLTV